MHLRMHFLRNDATSKQLHQTHLKQPRDYLCREPTLPAQLSLRQQPALVRVQSKILLENLGKRFCAEPVVGGDLAELAGLDAL